MAGKLKSNCSFSWRSLIWGRDLLKKGLLWRIGNGMSVDIFGDAWLPTLPEGMTLRKIRCLEKVKVAALINDNGDWDLQSCHSLLLPVEVEEASKLERLNHKVEDVLYWKHEKRGEYTVKTGYLVASGYFDSHAATSSSEYSKWWKYLWSFQLPQRIKIFAWRVFRNIIPTELNLAGHHVPVLGRCEWCSKGWGSTAHVLIFCEKVRNMWFNSGFWTILKKWENFDIEVIGGAMQEEGSREYFEQWIVGMWLVWKALCGEKHKASTRGWADLNKESIIYIENFREARAQAAVAERILPTEGSKKWIRPRRGRYRLDVDYSVDEAAGRGGVGAIARDHSGDVIFAFMKPTAASSSVLHGELKAMMHGICYCIEKELSPVEVYTDSILAVMVVEEESFEDSVLYEDLFEFFKMVKELNVISVGHIRREANGAAHELALLARTLDSTCVWHENWPEWLSSIVGNDIQ